VAHHDSLRRKLKTSLVWIIEAEHYGFVNLQYMCLYIAIERLRIDFLSTFCLNLRGRGSISDPLRLNASRLLTYGLEM
jgi:hypothetical protein